MQRERERVGGYMREGVYRMQTALLLLEHRRVQVCRNSSKSRSSFQKRGCGGRY